MTPYIILAAIWAYLAIGAVCARMVFLHAWRNKAYGNSDVKPYSHGTPLFPEAHAAAQRRNVHEDMTLWAGLWPVLGAAAFAGWAVRHTLLRKPGGKQ